MRPLNFYDPLDSMFSLKRPLWGEVDGPGLVVSSGMSDYFTNEKVPPRKQRRVAGSQMNRVLRQLPLDRWPRADHSETRFALQFSADTPSWGCLMWWSDVTSLIMPGWAQRSELAVRVPAKDTESHTHITRISSAHHFARECRMTVCSTVWGEAGMAMGVAGWRHGQHAQVTGSTGTVASSADGLV